MQVAGWRSGVNYRLVRATLRDLRGTGGGSRAAKALARTSDGHLQGVGDLIGLVAERCRPLALRVNSIVGVSPSCQEAFEQALDTDGAEENELHERGGAIPR
jgi:hypothetical protein